VRALSWAGGNHANYNCGLFAPAFLGLLQPGDFSRIVGRIRELVPGVGVIQMCCQPAEWNGLRNPMLELGGQRAVNRAFVMDIREGFEAFLEKGNAKRKRKKFRFQEKMAAAAGGYRLVMPSNPREANDILGEFLRQKSERLRSRGLRDVFASGHTREFLTELVRRSAGLDEPLLRLFALEIGGKVRAVLGGGVHQNRLSAYFSSIALDDLTTMSPGEMLLYLFVRQCATEGLTHIDLGAGEERYKRSWCNETLELFDVIIPTSLPGMPFAASARASLAMKRVVRESPFLWNAVGKWRGLRRRFTP
jgi:CelD/BcsL family acetyltransferase involved in cellulose biosynthesis